MAQAANALVAISVLSAVIFLVYGPWQWVCTDFARQVVFEKRDQLFDLARSGELNFKSREYRTIRSSLESSIRFAHDLTWPLLIVMWLSRKPGSDEKSELLEAVNRIEDASTRGKVVRAVNDAQRALILMVIVKSPLAIVALPLVAAGIAAIFFVEGCRRHAANLANLVGNIIQIEAEGFPELQVQRRRSFWQPQ